MELIKSRSLADEGGRAVVLAGTPQLEGSDRSKFTTVELLRVL